MTKEQVDMLMELVNSGCHILYETKNYLGKYTKVDAISLGGTILLCDDSFVTFDDVNLSNFVISCPFRFDNKC